MTNSVTWANKNHMGPHATPVEPKRSDISSTAPRGNNYLGGIKVRDFAQTKLATALQNPGEPCDGYFASICRQACSRRVCEMLAFVRLLGVIRMAWFLPVVRPSGGWEGRGFRRLVGG